MTDIKFPSIDPTAKNYGGGLYSLNDIAYMLVEDIITAKKPEVNALVSNFNAKKSAHRKKHAKVHKTGILNVNKLHEYKFNDNIFLNKTSYADAKSHGFYMLIDWSGSMSAKDKNYSVSLAIKALVQSLVYAEFCKKTDIPFVVDTYTSIGAYSYSADVLREYNDLCEKYKEYVEEDGEKPTFDEIVSLYIKNKSMLLDSDREAIEDLLPIGCEVDLSCLNLVTLLSSDFDKKQMKLSKIEIGKYIMSEIIQNYDGSSILGLCTKANQEKIQGLVREVEKDYEEVLDNLNDLYWHKSTLTQEEKVELGYHRRSIQLDAKMPMGGTPTFEAFTAIEPKLAAFKAKYGFEKLCLIHLTDGDPQQTTMRDVSIDTNGKKKVSTRSFYPKHSYKIHFNLSNGKKLKVGRNPLDTLLKGIREEYNATVINYQLYNSLSSFKNTLPRGYSSIGEYKVDGKFYMVPEVFGYNSIIGVDASKMNINSALEDGLDFDTSKKLTSANLKNSLAKAKKSDNSIFIVKKLMEIAA